MGSNIDFNAACPTRSATVPPEDVPLTFAGTDAAARSGGIVVLKAAVGDG